MSIRTKNCSRCKIFLKFNHPPSCPVMLGAPAHVFSMYDPVWELGQTAAELNSLQVSHQADIPSTRWILPWKVVPPPSLLLSGRPSAPSPVIHHSTVARQMFTSQRTRPQSRRQLWKIYAYLDQSIWGWPLFWSLTFLCVVRNCGGLRS